MIWPIPISHLFLYYRPLFTILPYVSLSVIFVIYDTDLAVELRHLVHCLVGGLRRTDQVEHGRQPLGPGDVPRGTLRCPRRLVHLAGYCCILHLKHCTSHTVYYKYCNTRAQ